MQLRMAHMMARVLRALVAIAMLAATVLLAFLLLIKWQPISAPNWVENALRQRIADTADGLVVELESVKFDIDDQTFRPGLHVPALTVSDAQASWSVEGRNMLIAFDLGGLFRGNLKPAVVRSDEFDVQITQSMPAPADTDSAGESRDSPSLPYAELLRSLDADLLASLDQLEFTRFRLDLERIAPNSRLTAEGDLRMFRDSDRRTTSSDLQIRHDDQVLASLALQIDDEDGSSESYVNLEGSTSEFRQVLQAMGTEIGFLGPDVLAVVTLSFPVSEGGNIDMVALDVRLSAASLGQGYLENPIYVEDAVLQATYWRSSGQLEIGTLELDADELALRGNATLQMTDGFASGSVMIHRASGAMPDLGILAMEPLVMSAELGFDFTSGILEVDNFRLDRAESSLDWKVSLGTQRGAEFLELQVGAGNMTIGEFISGLPEKMVISYPAHYADLLSDAQVIRLIGSLRFEPDSTPQRFLTVVFADLDLTYLEGMAPLQDMGGRIQLRGDHISMQLSSGILQVDEAGAIDLTGSTIRILNLAAEVPLLDASLKIDTDLQLLLEFLDQEPLGLTTEAGIEKSMFSARVDGTVKLEVPFRPDASLRDVRFQASGKGTEIVSSPIFRSHVLQASELAVDVSSDGIEISGGANFGPLPVELRWKQSFSAEAYQSSTVTGTFELSQDALHRLGIDLPQDTLVGAAPAEYLVRLNANQPAVLSVSANIEQLALKVPLLDWTKTKGSSGQVQVEGEIGNELKIDRLQIVSEQFDVEASIAFDQSGVLRGVEIPSATFGDLYGGPIRMELSADGDVSSIHLLGALDFRQFNLASQGSTVTRGLASPLDLNIRQVVLTPYILASDVEVELGREDDILARALVTINLGPRPEITMVETAEGYLVRLVANDASELVKAIGASNQLIGGELDLTVRLDHSLAPTGGTLRISDVIVSDLPFLGRLLGYFSITGLVEALINQGFSFEDIVAEFSIEDDILTIINSSAIGTTLGIAMSGTYNLVSTEVDVAGTISPLFLLSRSLDATLQVNKIVEAEEGEGLGAVGFRISGTSENYETSISPLTVLLPGRLNKLN